MVESIARQTEQDTKRDFAVESSYQNWLRYTQRAERRYGLTDKLGLISEREGMLFESYMTQRMIRYSIYRIRSFLNEPGTEEFRKFRVIGKLISVFDRDLDRQSKVLKRDEESIGDLRADYLDEVQTPRVIELSANELVSQSMRMSDFSTEVKFVPDPQKIETWGLRWNGKIQNQRANDIVMLGDLRPDNV